MAQEPVTGMHGLVKPGVESAIHHFEAAYDLRKTTAGKLVARPSAPSPPGVVIGSGDLADEVRLWWRRAAETWNQDVARAGPGRSRGGGSRGGEGRPGG